MAGGDSPGGEVDHKSVLPRALDAAATILGPLSNLFVLVVGTGEIAEEALKDLRRRGVRDVAFVGRDPSRAITWESGHPERAWSLEEIDKVLWRADLVIVCSRATGPVITAEQVRHALALRCFRTRPLLILDLGVPGDVEAEVGRLAGVQLRNLDSFRGEVGAEGIS
ncbi:MAG: hypothetical protein HY608_09030 [Planctomycetes bacterium]|nr:hypothetical protein [Planctomycetota bacterium]